MEEIAGSVSEENVGKQVGSASDRRLRFREGESVQEHIKTMTEFELAIVGDAIEEGDQVVYLLATSQDSFDTIVTALEVSAKVPKMETVMERLLHAEGNRRRRQVLILTRRWPSSLKGKVQHAITTVNSRDTSREFVQNV